ncbi:MAG: neutral/alkaline non-lysosomal ceramidase N-terminal domain-containing protein [Planctomycetes bacterium]|nr:neutral/alkaline non-lysosomal ceramidase N-terminal domain-containing protein [Planctomycetota bacterium]
MKIGFGRVDITPRVGVELCGFGPYITRHSIAVRDRLWARAMAIDTAGERVVIVSCDLPGTGRWVTERVRAAVTAATGLAGSSVMVHCTHTHSGPNTIDLVGWGEPDAPYRELLPAKIAKACIDAIASAREATLSHAEVPCEGIGQNREYDRDGLPIDEVMVPGWRPKKPELTDTTCHVLKAEAGGKVIGFVSYFGCHPVVCCQETRHIHGDFCGVATNLVEADHPGAVGLFLQGAQGDVNPRFVHKPEAESLKALDVIAGEYAAAVRNGIAKAKPIAIDEVAARQRFARFSRKPWDAAKLRELLTEHEQTLATAPDETSWKTRMAVVYVNTLRTMLAASLAGEDLSPRIELQGFRLGPIALLASPFETFQQIKNEVVAAARALIPLVLSFANESTGYATDRTAAARGGYAADMVPLMYGFLPYADAHGDLVRELVALDGDLAERAVAVAGR